LSNLTAPKSPITMRFLYFLPTVLTSLLPIAHTAPLNDQTHLAPTRPCTLDIILPNGTTLLSEIGTIQTLNNLDVCVIKETPLPGIVTQLTCNSDPPQVRLPPAEDILPQLSASAARKLGVLGVRGELEVTVVTKC
ncbi:hypothetical protein HK097_008941, partial [Rhizophlyctis rosea]